MKTLNEPYSKLSMKRRYEAWFLRLGLSDGSGAWWFRYLLMNLGRGGCPEGGARAQPAQVWATWFPRTGKPETWIQGLGPKDFRLGKRCGSPYFFEMGENRMGETECSGRIEANGHRVGWDLRYQSTFRVQLSSKGWIGFSRTPHSDAVFSGEITLDGRTFRGEPLGFGVQGHNCGYRHRRFWTWTHLHFLQPDGTGSTFEALVYEMPLGLFFRKGLLWHRGRELVFRHLTVLRRDRSAFVWSFCCPSAKFNTLKGEVRGRKGFVHRLEYARTDCSGTFEVANDSLASARLILRLPGGDDEELTTDNGAVLEMAGE